MTKKFAPLWLLLALFFAGIFFSLPGKAHAPELTSYTLYDAAYVAGPKDLQIVGWDNLDHDQQLSFDLDTNAWHPEEPLKQKVKVYAAGAPNTTSLAFFKRPIRQRDEVIDAQNEGRLLIQVMLIFVASMSLTLGYLAYRN